MIFSEAVNIAEDLAKAQTEGEHEGSTSFTEVSAIDEVAEVPSHIRDISSTGDAATAPSDLSSLEFADHIRRMKWRRSPFLLSMDSDPPFLKTPARNQAMKRLFQRRKSPTQPWLSRQAPRRYQFRNRRPRLPPNHHRRRQPQTRRTRANGRPRTSAVDT
jgi:hypothetical protein